MLNSLVHVFYALLCFVAASRIDRVIGGTWVTTLDREYVYGPGDVNEFVAQFKHFGQLYYYLQDGSLNDTGVADFAGNLKRQYVYAPYGECIVAEATGDAPYNRVGFQGMFIDVQNVFQANRNVTPGPGRHYLTANRVYDPPTGRWLQRDPNETAQPILEALAMNGSGPSPSSLMSDLEGHYGNGPNTYQAFMSNPVNGSDPLGLFAFGELLQDVSTRAYVAGSLFAGVHPLATRFVGGLLAAVDIYAFVQYQEVQDVVLAQPNAAGFLEANALALRGAIAELLSTGGSIRAVFNASDSTLSIWSRARTAIRSLYSSGEDAIRVVTIARSSLPQYSGHVAEAQAAGHPSVLTIERAGASARREAATAGYSKVSGMDLDEYPPAMFAEGGAGASVKAISRSENRSAGVNIRNQIADLPNGSRVRIEVVP